MKNLNTISKLLLSILLLLCLADMPYGYYQFVRYISTIAFVYFAYEDKSNGGKLFVVFIILAILFQPFIKISLGRVLWNIVDVIVAIGLLISLFRNKKT
jgi:hypothetical protein